MRLTSSIASRTAKVGMLSLVFIFVISSSRAQDTSVLPQLNYLFKAGDHGYSCFRIPALLHTSKNNLLAFAEARKNGCGDAGDIDLVLRRSGDGGKTWSELQVVWSDSTNTCGNPVPVQDAGTGKIWLLTSWNLGTDHEKEIRARTSKEGRKVFVCASGDEGETWSGPEEITSLVKNPNWTWYATGPCHGLQLTQGKYKGRMLVPINHVDFTTGINLAATIYSDDHGKTWQLGEDVPTQSNETTIAEIGKGEIILNARSSDRTIKYRQVTTSPDGGKTWMNMHSDSTLIEPICQGSLLSYKLSSKKSVLLFSNPASQTTRSNLTLRFSLDNGRSWAGSKTVFAGPSAYSDIAVNKCKQVSCLYEAGKLKPYEGIAFTTIGIDQLLKP